MGIPDETPRNIDVDGLIARIRSRLKPGGPDIDYRALYAYIDERLPDDEARPTVQRLLYTWQSWHDASWRVRAELDFHQTDLPLDESE